MLNTFQVVSDSIASGVSAPGSEINPWIPIVATGVITVLGFLGYKGIVGKIEQKVIEVSKEFQELAHAIVVITSDGKVTPEEVEQVIKEAKDVIKSIKG